MAEKQLLHLVIGGELSDLDHNTFKDPSQIDLVGAFAYVALIVGLLVSQRKLSGQSRLAALALVACVLLSSLLMDFQLRYHNVVFICLSLYAIFELLPGAKPVSGGRQSAAGSDASPQGVSLRRVEV